MRALSSGTTVEIGLAEPLDQRLVTTKKEQAVRHDRATERAAELVTGKVRFAQRVEIVRASSASLRWYSIRAAAVSVRARLGEHVDLAAGFPAELGAIGVGLDAKLSDALHAERRSSGAAGGSVREIVLQRAIEQVDVRARVLTVHAHPQAMRHDRAAVPVRIGEHARLQERKIGVVASVERQRFDRLEPTR